MISPGASLARNGTLSPSRPIAQPSAANDNPALYVTGGPDGLRAWRLGEVVADGLTFLRANALLRAFEARYAIKTTNRSA